MPCDVVADRLPDLAAGADQLGDDECRHVDQCLRCQAELVRYRKLLRALRALRTDVLVPAPGLLADVLAALEEADERHAVRSVLHGRRVACLGGLAAATAAGVGSVIVLARRRRPAA